MDLKRLLVVARQATSNEHSAVLLRRHMQAQKVGLTPDRECPEQAIRRRAGVGCRGNVDLWNLDIRYGRCGLIVAKLTNIRCSRIAHHLNEVVRWNWSASTGQSPRKWEHDRQLA